MSTSLGVDPPLSQCHPRERFPPSPALYLCVFAAWLLSLAWFLPHLQQLILLTSGCLNRLNLLLMASFTALSWLYGFHNLTIVCFSWLHSRNRRQGHSSVSVRSQSFPPVAVLYTTCNDFIEEAAASAVLQDYPSYTVYILDDSTDPSYQRRVDVFAERYPDVVRVVRRSDRRGYKAGNLNDALRGPASQEPLFAIVDADERLPVDFISRSVSIFVGNPLCGFVQANHQSHPDAQSSFARAMGISVDIHWRWYHPFRNRYGFVILLGHGAMIRRQCWEEIGGFPEIVSEDFAFAVRARLHGWYGYFAEGIICFEDFPSSIRAFRVRHMKWTRGTCEFLAKEVPEFLRSSAVTLTEKLDVLLPVVRLPFSVSSLLYTMMALVAVPSLLGNWRFLPVYLGADVAPEARQGAEILFHWDLFTMTVLLFVSPSLCFIIELGRRPIRLFKLLCYATVLYGGIAPLVSVGIFGYLTTGEARFLVTGDLHTEKKCGSIREFLVATHPDHAMLRSFETLCGILLSWSAVHFSSLSMLGIACAVALHPTMHWASWGKNSARFLLYLPFTLVLVDILLMGSYVLLQ